VRRHPHQVDQTLFQTRRHRLASGWPSRHAHNQAQGLQLKSP
jgi:hypothetical protein